MPWRGHVKRFCKTCGRAREEGELLTARGNCMDCAHRLATDNLTGLVTHRGPHFSHWRRRLLASLGTVLPDE